MAKKQEWFTTRKRQTSLCIIFLFDLVCTGARGGRARTGIAVARSSSFNLATIPSLSPQQEPSCMTCSLLFPASIARLVDGYVLSTMRSLSFQDAIGFTTIRLWAIPNLFLEIAATPAPVGHVDLADCRTLQFALGHVRKNKIPPLHKRSVAKYRLQLRRLWKWHLALVCRQKPTHANGIVDALQCEKKPCIIKPYRYKKLDMWGFPGYSMLQA